MLTVSLTLAAVVFSMAVALRFGGAPERLGAGVVGGMLAIAFAARPLLPPQFDRVDPVSLGVDVLGFAAFLCIGIFAWRLWPLCAASLQLLALSAHLTRALDIHIHPFVYAALKSGPSYLILLLLVGGSILHRRRIRTFGSDRCWRSWSQS